MNNNIPKIAVVVSRHKTFIEYLKEENIVGEKTPVIGHATADDVSGKHVLGAIPPHLAVLAASVTTVPIIVPPQMRGVELSVDEIRSYARKPETYIITKMEAE